MALFHQEVFPSRLQAGQDRRSGKKQCDMRGWQETERKGCFDGAGRGQTGRRKDRFSDRECHNDCFLLHKTDRLRREIPRVRRNTLLRARGNERRLRNGPIKLYAKTLYHRRCMLNYGSLKLRADVLRPGHVTRFSDSGSSPYSFSLSTTLQNALYAATTVSSLPESQTRSGGSSPAQ